MSMVSQRCFTEVDALVKSWPIGDYQYHIRLLKDRGVNGVNFKVIFSQPTKTHPVSEHTVTVFMTVMPRPPDSSAALNDNITYTIEGQLQLLSGSTPLRKESIDVVIRRKKTAHAMSLVFAEQGKLPEPRKFMSGEHRVHSTVRHLQVSGENESHKRVEKAAETLAGSLEIEQLNHAESEDELEELLLEIFKQADRDGNGMLDEREFKSLLQTSDLDLTEAESKQLLAMADVNVDGLISYTEFVPVGADIIQTMRMRKLHAATMSYESEVAEEQARESLHGMDEEAMTRLLVEAFQKFDVDKSGFLDANEMRECLVQLDLRSQQGLPPKRFSQREVSIVMANMDDDGSGKIEYSEFAPRMFRWMVEAVKLGFIHRQVTELEQYLQQHVEGYDVDGTKTLSRSTMKRALAEADFLKPPLTQVQILTLLADAPFDENDRLVYTSFLSDAAPLVQAMCDPILSFKRGQIRERTTVLTPMECLTDEEMDSFMLLAKRVFATYDADGSGKLNFAEFCRALKEPQLGLTEKQSSYLVSLVDADDEENIDYAEFSDLLFNSLVELACMDAIEKAVQGNLTVSAAMMMLDPSHFYIPLLILFNQLAGSSNQVEGAILAETLTAKSMDWGTPQLRLVVAEIHNMDHVSFTQLSELLVKACSAYARKASMSEIEAPTGE